MRGDIFPESAAATRVRAAPDSPVRGKGFWDAEGRVGVGVEVGVQSSRTVAAAGRHLAGGIFSASLGFKT